MKIGESIKTEWRIQSKQSNEGTESIQISSSLFPDLESLTAGLSYVFCGKGSADCQVTTIERDPNPFTSYAPSEIVTCRLGNGVRLRLLCKYVGNCCYDYGAKGGIKYEAEVYRRVLQPLKISQARCYGSFKDVITDKRCLVLEYLDECLRVSKAPFPAAMHLAARWLGRFHALNETRRSKAPIEFLKKYDYEYYLGWANRTSLFASHLHQSFPWLTTLCKRWKEIVNELLLLPETVIHGEFYSQNVLIRDGIVYPIDWESAAIAFGEIDLAALTEGWPEKIVQQCNLEYQLARWPEGAPANFQQMFDAARLYLIFRWLGEKPEWTTHEINLWRFEQLHCIGERLGIVSLASQRH